MRDPAAGCAMLLVFTDAIRFKIRDEGFVRNNAVHIAIGILPVADKQILGIWIEQHEGLGFWLRPMNKLKNRGTGHNPTAVVDGLKGFPDVRTAMLARLKQKHLRQSPGGSRRHSAGLLDAPPKLVRFQLRPRPRHSPTTHHTKLRYVTWL